MKNSDEKTTGKKPRFPLLQSRRDFLRLSAVSAVAAAGSPAMAERLIDAGARMGAMGRSNRLPSRIAILHDPEMEGHIATINRDRVEEDVHLGVRVLTGIDDTAAAFESLFTGLGAASSIAIKVNCIGPTDTRWETVRGIVSGLSLMLGGTYDVSNVTIYDRHNLTYHGYVTSEFTFNGNYPLITGNNGASGSGHEPVAGYELSQYLLDADFVIDVPALKSHSNGNNQITVGLKNHYGSCHPASLCGNIPGMLALNADTNIKDKTCLIVTCGIRGTYNGGPGEAPQSWNTFTEATPNTLFFTTDPVTNEYWARDMINAERQTHGWSDKPCPWIEQASDPPYSLGVSDPANMTVISFDPSYVHVGEGEASTGGLFFAPNVPNPFRESTALRFRMAKPSRVSVGIYEASGRLVREIGHGDFPGGYNEIVWDGRDSKGRAAAPGVYFARLNVGSKVRARRIVKVR